MAAATTMLVQQHVPAQIVANAFVQQYYHILHYSPGVVYRFYQDVSKLGRPENDGSMSITTTMQAINDKILSLRYGDFRAEIKSVDAQESFNGGVHVLVTGYLGASVDKMRNFTQTFFLAPQDNGYFVLNDMFRYTESVNQNNAVFPVVNVVDAIPVQTDPPPPNVVPIPVETIHGAEEANKGEVNNIPENGNEEVVEEVLITEVADKVPDESRMMVELDTKTEEMGKKSYASIVMDLKETTASFSPPPPPPRKAAPKGKEPVNPTPPVATDEPGSSSDAVDNENNLDSEADGYSIYIKGLPVNATIPMLAEEFKKFGPIKTGGIQVRSNKQGGFCFGFVEFEAASAVQKAIEASPIAIGGRQAIVEEKRSTNSRVNNRGRFQSGRGAGFRNEGTRGRGNYGGGRAYNRGDFNNRGEFVTRGEFGHKSEFGNRGGYRGGSSNRGDGYHKFSNGGRVNGVSGMANGTSKITTPRLSATA